MTIVLTPEPHSTIRSQSGLIRASTSSIAAGVSDQSPSSSAGPAASSRSSLGVGRVASIASEPTRPSIPSVAHAPGPAYTLTAMLEPMLNRPCGGRYGNMVEAVGNTPLVELPRLSPKPAVRIFAKLEGRNPTGSVKDRVAKGMIEAAEAEGAIEPGQTILEPTSGNTGISLAMICGRKGYPVKVVMPDNVTEERNQLLRMFGAEIVYSEGAKGSNGAVELALEMAAADASYYMPYQYGNQANPDAHYHGTAVEILDELDQVAAFVAGLGTGGTLMGVGRRLKENDPATKIVAAEPMQGELVQGLRSLEDGFIPPIIDLSLLDRKIMVSNRDAIVWTQRLLREEGLFAGVSSGAIAAICVRIADQLDEGNIVFIVPDDGWKYLSSGLYTRPIEELEGVDSTVWW
jgi:[CysO sulfur-carrier protein]-thiocarboxylate-dependent cysteine synthase